MKRSMQVRTWLVVAGIFTLGSLTAAGPLTLLSPDEKIQVEVSVGRSISYSVSFQGRIILAPSRLALTVNDGQVLGQGASVKNTKVYYISESIYPEVREKSKVIENKCNELTIEFEEPFNLVFRAYNDGIAYRFITRLEGSMQVVGERIEYDFPEDCFIYFPEEGSFYTSQERPYQHKRLSELAKGTFSSIPVLVEAADGPKIAITESDQIDYPGFYLEAQGGSMLRAVFPGYPKTEEDRGDRDRIVTEAEDFIAKTAGSRPLPWRVMIIAAHDGELVLSPMVYKLASPCEIEDPSWIRPGKAAWDWWNALNTFGVDFRSGVNTDNYKYFIDFASKYGLEYVILDEGWYPKGDLLKTVDTIDMEALRAYAKEKGVGLIFWTTWKTLDEQFEAAMDQFEKWGAAGLKVDFMQRDDQKMMQFYEKVAAECAKRKLLVNFHGACKPAGLRRRFPNVITREGVMGNEYNKWSTNITPSHRLTLPFIRMTAGPMDFTPGAMRNWEPGRYHPNNLRPGSQGTRCHEMAMYVIYESPLQMLCDNPAQYLREPECMEFLGPVPTVWDDSKVLDAKVGAYLYMARQSGKDWYLGGMTNEEKRSCELDLSFLDKDAAYLMTLFRDGVNADRCAEDYKRIVRRVTSEDKVKIDLAPGGGFAARLVKRN
jgi:alpha-glucosidase